MNNKNILNCGEMAKLIGVTTMTLRNWNKKGTFKGKKTPTGRLFYTRDQYDEYKKMVKDKITLDEMAELIGVTKTTLRKWNRKGIFKCKKLPNGVLCYDKKQYDDYMNGIFEDDEDKSGDDK